jgi:hypothetical protein
VIAGYAPAQPAAPAAATVPAESTKVTSLTQQVLLSLVRSVRNLRDECDVQCLAFLAGELDLLRKTPFCFSRRLSKDAPLPVSLVLRDTFDSMVSRKLLGWEGGNLCALVEPSSATPLRDLVGDGISWLGALLPGERQALAKATVQLDGTGGTLLSSRADSPIQRVVARMMGGNEAA